jgi:D-alanyl-D-alanine carboxypeptidase
LNNVTSLAGYAYSEDGELLIYTIFMNDFRKGVWDLRKLQDKIISIIAEFSRFH